MGDIFRRGLQSCWLSAKCEILGCLHGKVKSCRGSHTTRLQNKLCPSTAHHLRPALQNRTGRSHSQLPALLFWKRRRKTEVVQFVSCFRSELQDGLLTLFSQVLKLRHRAMQIAEACPILCAVIKPRVLTFQVQVLRNKPHQVCSEALIGDPQEFQVGAVCTCCPSCASVALCSSSQCSKFNLCVSTASQLGKQ